MIDPSAEAPAGSEHFEIYNGDVVLSFDDGDHKYFARSEEEDYGHLDSTTQIKGALAKPALKYWAVNQTIEYLEEHWEPGRKYDEVEIEEMLSEAKSARYKTSGKAMKIGTLVHEWIEEYVKAKIQNKALDVIGPDQSEVDTDMVRDLSLPYNDEARGACEEFLKWEAQANPEWIASEQRAFSKNHEYAGTYDADVIIDGERVLLDFKGLPLDTTLPTPGGATTIGEVSVGDRVLGPDGEPCHVTEKSEVHKRKTYEITFDDGSTIIADDEHQWMVDRRDKNKRVDSFKEDVVMTTEEMVSFLSNNEGLDYQDTHYLYVNNPDPITLPEKELPIDPYVYGAWLGDGTKKGGTMTGVDIEIFDEVKDRGYDYSDPHGNDDSKAPTRTLYGLRTELIESDLIGSRDVPMDYLRGSVSQRLELLRGLMDTDGSYNEAREQAVFNSSDEELAKAVEQLALSLGERPYRVEVDVNGFGLETTTWRVSWRCTQFNPFLLPRKADLVEIRDGLSTHRQIKSIEEVPAVETQCIAVDSESSCYLATENWIPTHNTSKRIYDDYWLQLGAYVYAREEETHHMATETGDPNERIHYDQMLILRVPKREGQDFEVAVVDDREEIVNHAKTFLSLLQVHNWDS